LELFDKDPYANMAASPLNAVLSGAIFGAALTAAGVYSPTVIIQQMKFQDFHMMKAFLSASASSACAPLPLLQSFKIRVEKLLNAVNRLAILLAQKYNFTACKPRLPQTLNWFSPYDGNIIGGALLGAGMALTGACPGTVLPQLATGVPSAPYVLCGGLVGGVLFSKFGKPLIGKIDGKGKDKEVLVKPTVYQAFGTDQARALAVYEAVLLSVVAAVGYLGPEGKEVLLPGAVGGVLIGFSQLAGLFLTGNTLGVSTAYEQVGDLFWWAKERIVDGKDVPRPSIRSTAFVFGSVAGSFGIWKLLIEGLTLAGGVEVKIGVLRAVFGGVLLTFGARIAGGCTSGHGISGMSQMSISSFVSVAAMFGGGMGVAALMG